MLKVYWRIHSGIDPITSWIVPRKYRTHLSIPAEFLTDLLKTKFTKNFQMRFKSVTSVFFGFIFVVHLYRTVTDSQGNYSLIKSTMTPKKKYYFCFIIDHVDKITQLMTFVSTEIFSRLRVEGTVYMFDSYESHDILPPRIKPPELNRISMT